MDGRDRQSAEREAQLMQANREELVERIGRAMREDGVPTFFPAKIPAKPG